MLHIWCLWKLSNFQDPPPPLSSYVQSSSTPLILDVQFETNPPPSQNDNQSIKRKGNIILGWLLYVIRSFLQIGSRFQYELLYLEGLTWNNSENADFVVTPSPQTNILTSNPKPNLMPDQNHSRRPNICTTENYLRNYNPPTVPGYSSYATVSKELHSGKAFFRSFSGANSKQLNHYIIPTLVDDKPDVVLLHVGTNDILSNPNDMN